MTRGAVIGEEVAVMGEEIGSGSPPAGWLESRDAVGKLGEVEGERVHMQEDMLVAGTSRCWDGSLPPDEDRYAVRDVAMEKDKDLEDLEGSALQQRLTSNAKMPVGKMPTCDEEGSQPGVVSQGKGGKRQEQVEEEQGEEQDHAGAGTQLCGTGIATGDVDREAAVGGVDEAWLRGTALSTRQSKR